MHKLYIDGIVINKYLNLLKGDCIHIWRYILIVNKYLKCHIQFKNKIQSAISWAKKTKENFRKEIDSNKNRMKN